LFTKLTSRRAAGLQSKNDVEAAAVTLRERMEAIGVDLKHILLQREIRNGIEALVGVSADPVFGPMLVCGLGGVLVEVIKDTSFRLPPVSDTGRGRDDCQAAHRHASPTGIAAPRPRPKRPHRCDPESLCPHGLIPELQELDLNPVKVLETGSGVSVVDARMRISPPGP